MFMKPFQGAMKRRLAPKLTVNVRKAHAVRPKALTRRSVTTAGVSSSFAASTIVPAAKADGTLSADLPDTCGVYAVYDASGVLQYIGLSRKINVSVATHLEAFDPGTVAFVKCQQLPNGTKEELTEAWKSWIGEAVNTNGSIPPGNAPGEKAWQQRRPRMAKSEIRLTPGKGLNDLSCSVVDLVDQVVKSVPVVAFVKGTRTAPQCGFSYKVLTLLSEVAGGNFEVVNVLDEVYNPGLREAIKDYTQWPTIPQVFVNGEFIGGADIVEQMHSSGELKIVVQEALNVKR